MYPLQGRHWKRKMGLDDNLMPGDVHKRACETVQANVCIGNG